MADNVKTLLYAEAIAESLRDDPTLTVRELAAAHDLAEDKVVEILDSHTVVDGKVSHGGEGLGGGWVPTEES